MHNSWSTPRSVSSEQTSSPDHCQNIPRRRIQPQGTTVDDWHAKGQNNQSESSEADDDVDTNQKSNGNIKKHYDRASDNPHYDSIAKMPYRSRSAVYSPSPLHHDAHNDSGYSTRLYGSSKGASPSLSGQLECDVILPPTEMHYPNAAHPATLLEEPRGHDITVHERSANNIVINIGTASLV